MDIVVIILLVLGVIVLVKGKPLWNSWRSNWVARVDAIIYLVWAVIQLVWGVLVLWGIQIPFLGDQAWKLWWFSVVLLLFFIVITTEASKEED